jgi:hypothetical protein
VATTYSQQDNKGNTSNMKDKINDEITDRIATVENDELRSFLTEIVSFEREHAAQSKPHYKSTYRSEAMQYVDVDEEESETA